MTWRERIAAARERGAFTAKDRSDIGHVTTCFLGDCSRRSGLHWEVLCSDARAFALARAFGPIVLSVYANDFDAAESLLDQIEDRALQLKREATP